MRKRGNNHQILSYERPEIRMAAVDSPSRQIKLCGDVPPCCVSVPMARLVSPRMAQDAPLGGPIVWRCSELSRLPFGASLLADSSLRGLDSSLRAARAGRAEGGEKNATLCQRRWNEMTGFVPLGAERITPLGVANLVSEGLVRRSVKWLSRTTMQNWKIL